MCKTECSIFRAQGVLRSVKYSNHPASDICIHTLHTYTFIFMLIVISSDVLALRHSCQGCQSLVLSTHLISMGKMDLPPSLDTHLCSWPQEPFFPVQDFPCCSNSNNLEST